MKKQFMTLGCVALLSVLAGCGDCCKKDAVTETVAIETITEDHNAMMPAADEAEGKEMMEADAQ